MSKFYGNFQESRKLAETVMDDLPSDLLAIPVPPVAIIGLNAMSSHAVLWRALSEGGGSNR